MIQSKISIVEVSCIFGSEILFVEIQARFSLFFSNWIAWIKFIPIPSGRLLMLIIFINLSFYFLRPNIFKLPRLGITITHMGAFLLLFGGGITAYYSQEGRMAIREGQINNNIDDYYSKEGKRRKRQK